MSSATPSEERKITNSDWAELPKHLLDSVLEKLVSAVDYLRFSVVCMSWYHVAKENYKSARVRMSGPMLLLISSDEEEDTWNLFNVMEDKVLDMQVRLPNKRFCGSSKGWLVAVEENYDVTLLNPFYRVKGREDQENSIVRLPPMIPPDWFKVKRSCDYFIHKATISADPILDANKCIVVVIYEDRCQLAFIRLKDTKWTYLDKRWYPVAEVVHVEDNFYAVDNSDQLLSFEITRESNSDVTLAIKGLSQDYVNRNYLVHTDDGALWMVERILGWQVDRCVTTEFKIFELNSEKFEWIEKTTIGDTALFVGDNSSVSVLASKFPECQPNCIYFNQDNNRMDSEIRPCGPHDFGVYNVKSKEISKPYTTNAMNRLARTKLHPIWLVPTFFL